MYKYKSFSKSLCVLVLVVSVQVSTQFVHEGAESKFLVYNCSFSKYISGCVLRVFHMYICMLMDKHIEKSIHVYIYTSLKSVLRCPFKQRLCVCLAEQLV